MIQAIAVNLSKPARDIFTSYDLGCEYSTSCLTCPLPRCKHDEPHTGRRASNHVKDLERAQAFYEALKTMNPLAAARFTGKQYGINERTVHRILARVRER